MFLPWLGVVNKAKVNIFTDLDLLTRDRHMVLDKTGTSD